VAKRGLKECDVENSKPCFIIIDRCY